MAESTEISTAAVSDVPPAKQPPTEPSASGHSHPHHHHTQWVLMGAAAAAYVIYFFVGKLLGIPSQAGFAGSLLRQPGGGAIVAMLSAGALIVGVTAVMTWLTRGYWVYTGLLATAAGLTAWSFRGGPIRYVLLAPDNANAGTGVFIVLAIEMLLLGLFVGVAWLIVAPKMVAGSTPTKLASPSGITIQAILSQAAFIAVGVSLFVPNGEKKQAVFGVLAASFIATALVQHFFHDERHARWYWAGPILVGIVGYVMNAFGASAKEAVETGRLAGTFAALARPLPLDYASAGVAGAVMGYWIGSDHPVTAEKEQATPTQPA